MAFPDPYSNILGVSVCMFLDETNIWIMRWNKADCPGQRGWAHPTEGQNRIKGDKGELALAAWLSSAAALVFSYLWTWTQAGTTQMSEAHALPPQHCPSWISLLIQLLSPCLSVAVCLACLDRAITELADEAASVPGSPPLPASSVHRATQTGRCPSLSSQSSLLGGNSIQ